MTYRSSSTQFILTLGMSTLFLAAPCPPAPIIRGGLGGFDTRRIGGNVSGSDPYGVAGPHRRAARHIGGYCSSYLPLGVANKPVSPPKPSKELPRVPKIDSIPALVKGTNLNKREILATNPDVVLSSNGKQVEDILAADAP